MQRLAAEYAEPATCFLWQDKSDYRVCCYGSDGPIQCCGHGLLAAAYVLHTRSPYSSAYKSRAEIGSTAKKTSTRVPRLLPADGDEPFPVVEQSQRLWLSLPRLRCTACPVPDWAEAAFGSRPLRAALAGGDSSYLLLEFADADALALIDQQAVVAHICAQTRRAVIATAAVPSQTTAESRDGFDYVNRYFAPQYGVVEDPVTGSAHRVLGDYWSQWLGKSQLSGLQRSPTGGVVHTQVTDHAVAVSGRLSNLPSAAT